MKTAWPARACALAAVALLGVGAYLALRSAEPDPPLTVTEPERALGEVPLGRHPLTLAFVNQGRDERQILGIVEY